MPTARWDSKQILSDLEHFEVFKKLFESSEITLLRLARRTPWPNSVHKLSLVDVHLEFVEEVRGIKNRSKMVGQTGPLLMARALFNSLHKNFREPTYGHDTSRPAPDEFTAKLIRRNCRAVIVLNFMKLVMQAVTFNHYNPAVLNETGLITKEELIAAIDAFDSDPDASFHFLEHRVLRDLMR